MSGRAIVRCSWAGTAVFTLTAVPAALGGDALEVAGVVTALALFGVSLPVWVYALVRAAVRTSEGDDVVVASLFLLEGPVPRAVRAHLFGSLVAAVAVAGATAVAEPFGVLMPMLPLGLVGLWGACHGKFPARDRDVGGTSGASRHA